jgi:hypothetical protein
MNKVQLRVDTSIGDQEIPEVGGRRVGQIHWTIAAAPTQRQYRNKAHDSERFSTVLHGQFLLKR